MNKRGISEYPLITALEYVLLIMIAASLAVRAYEASDESNLNKLKAIDFSLILDSVFSVKDDIYLNYDLGKGVNSKVSENKVIMYQKNRNKRAEEVFVINSNYQFNELSEDKYNNLYVQKEGNLVNINGEHVFEGFGGAETPSGGGGAGGELE